MANIFAVTVLQKNQYSLATGGVVWAIPSAGLVVVPYTGTVNGVTFFKTSSVVA